MDQPSHEQVRLILEDADSRLRRAVNGRLKAIYADHTAKGLLMSGATIRVGVRAMEEEASRFTAGCVDKVAAIAMDPEAFAMVQEVVEIALTFLGEKLDEVIVKASGPNHNGPGSDRVRKAAEDLFDESRKQVRRQLELHRFTFTVRHRPHAQISVPSSVVAKSRGGKPIAAHWDEMWAAIAVALYTGNLQPDTQAEIERAMKDWLASKDIDAGDTSVRTRARHLWNKLREAD